MNNAMHPMEVKKKTDEGTNPKMTELLITLKIKASELYTTTDPTLTDLNKYCRLSDTNPPREEPDTRIEHFTSDVVRGQQVKWIARNFRKEEEGEFFVAIESIVYAYHKENELVKYRKENFFNAIAICSYDTETVRAKVMEDIEDGKVVYPYNINFSIKTEGGGKRSFSIDPRLKIDR